MKAKIMNTMHLETNDPIRVVEILNIPVICLKNGDNFKIEVETEEENQINVSVTRKKK